METGRPVLLEVVHKKSPDKSRLLVPGAGIEPAQPQWPQDFKSCVSTNSTIRAQNEKKSFDKKKAEYFRLIYRAENETRTRDPNLGKVVLYQLSYFRSMSIALTSIPGLNCECKNRPFA